MARSINTDPLLAHNFAIIDVPVFGALPFAFSVKALQSAVGAGNFVGAQSIDMPSVTVEMKDIKEMNWPFIHSVPTGFTTTAEATITWAVFNINTDMWAWMEQVIHGIIAPRRSLIVVQTRNDKIIPQRMTLLSDCVPTSWTPMSQLDAQSSAVCTEAITLNVHRIVPIPVPIPVTPPNASWAPSLPR